MKPFRDEIEALQQNGITKVAFKRLHDPAVIPLWFGEGDIPTPTFIRDAAKSALDNGETFYTHTRGRPELRDALKSYLDELYGIELDERRITVPGAAMLGVTIAAQMVMTTGDHGLIVGPVWPNIDAVFRVTGAEVSYASQHLTENGWQLSVAEILEQVRPGTKAIFVNSPCNPTGWVMSRQEQQELLTFCRDQRILIIADEVYHRTVFDGPHAPSFLEIAEEDDPLVVVNGFSKAWAMTGWRLGWMVAPARYAQHIAVLSECFNTGAPSIVQFAGIAALADGEELVKTLRTQYAGGRDIVMQILGQHPRIELSVPEGAFYAFPRVEGMGSSLDFAEALLQEYDVGVAPGYTFGPGNEEHFRLCFAQSHQRLTEALRRIVTFIDRRE